jgi:hypothetical protein
MLYSVWNYDTKAYDYYQGSGPKGAHAGAPPIRRSRSELGATPEQASWRVPSDARKVGSGDMPQGRIATIGGVSSLGDDALFSNPASLAVMAVIAYLAWKVLR